MKTFNLVQYLFKKISDKKKIAYFTNKQSIDYADLELKTKLAASALLVHGVIPGQRIVLSLNDNVELVFLFLASIAIGAYPVVLNPRLSWLNLSYILKDCDASIFFVEEENYSVVNKGLPFLAMEKKPLPIVHIRDFLSLGHSKWSNYFYSNLNDAVFMQYTSGTTGEPKGVIHTYQSILSCCELFAKARLKIQSQDVLYSTSKMFFGYGLGNSLFFPLYFNASAIIDDRWPTVEIIHQNIEKFAPTIFFAVPTIYQKVYSQEASPGWDRNIKLFFSAGAPLSTKLQQLWNKKYKCKIYQGLGTTEMCHVFITNDFENFRLGSTGKIIDGYEYKLINLQGDLITTHSQHGRLQVKGPSLSLGYWNNKSATQAKFTDGWYDTGDIFSADMEEFLYYHGREDDIFKVNGRWVFPAQIEAYVKENFPQIQDACLIPVEINFQIKGILFINGDLNDRELIIKNILHTLSNHFESFKVPSFCVYLDSFPYNDNGKISRNKLVREAEKILI